MSRRRSRRICILHWLVYRILTGEKCSCIWQMTALNHSWLLGDYVVRATPSKPDPNVRSNEKVDGGLYNTKDAPMHHEHTKWADIELAIECKTQAGRDDPFEDDEEKDGAPEPTGYHRRKVLGQIMSYASLVFQNQHRTHAWTLLIIGDAARLVRWDRSGVIASHKIEYVKQPITLTRFLWRLVRLSDLQRGHDPTAVRIRPDSVDYRLMVERANKPVFQDGTPIGEHALLLFLNSLKNEQPWWRLRVDDARGQRHFLVGAPHFITSALAGRGTRGYVALDESSPDASLVYLKDAWRVAHDRIPQEGKTLSDLNSDDNGGPVDGVPTMLYHGDVEEQVTQAQEAWRKKHPDEATCPLKTHRHYRLVVAEVGLPMSAFSDSRELVGLIAWCIQAHHQAYTRKGYIHRDISAGNVLIYPKPMKTPEGKTEEIRTGLLTDWELAKSIYDADDGPRQPDRTGTWQFMSASSLMNTSKRIIVQDDMESFFHLLLYFAIRYLPHNCGDVGRFMDSYFDGHELEDGVYYGGEKK
ncbi:hypothetical protein OH77DRAFT_1395667, partial [Trametes cingulata]